MRFTTKESRQQHLLASLIPDGIWSYAFNSSIEESYLPLIQGGVEKARLVLDEININQLSIDNKKEIWGLLALKQGLYPATFLQDVASILGLSSEKVFQITCQLGNTEYMQHLANTMPVQKFQELIDSNTNILSDIALNNQIDLLKFLETQASDYWLETALKREPSAIYFALEYNHLEIVKYLDKKFPEEITAFINEHSIFLSESAEKKGYEKVVTYIQHKNSEASAMVPLPDVNALTQDMEVKSEPSDLSQKLRIGINEARRKQPLMGLIPDNIWDDVFELSIENAYLPLIQIKLNEATTLLETIDPNKLSQKEKKEIWILLTLNQNQYPTEFIHKIGMRLDLSLETVFKITCQLGNKKYMEYLDKTLPAQTFQELLYSNYLILSDIALNNQVDLLQFLEEKAPKDWLITTLLSQYQPDEYPCRSAISRALLRNHIKFLRYVEKKFPEDIEEVFTNTPTHLFQMTARDGFIDTIRYFEEKVPQHLQEMISADDFYAFRLAANNAHMEVLNYIAEKAPEQLQAMIQHNDFEVYRNAAGNGHLDIVNFLETKAPQLIEAMVSVNYFSSLENAHRNNHKEIVFHLLQHPSVLEHAEQHIVEYGAIVLEFIHQNLDQLQNNKSEFEAEQVNAVFDVNREMAKRCFLMLRHLIRLNNETHLDAMRFLLSIPAVKNLAHRSSTSGQSNELLRLAISINNISSAELLLTLPEVHALAQRNNFYNGEANGEFNLEALAQNRESSMRALSNGEEKRLADALNHYNPILKQRGMVPSLITSLKETLLERFNEQPAFITRERNGIQEVITLPMEWEAFQALVLTPEERIEANKAYYQHKDHTAWRYLSIPNRWMHGEANYVNRSEDGSEFWSTFEEYQPLIALLFLGATDHQIPATDGYTFETRLEHFIEELALIGRAHNWDDTRVMLGREGNPITDEMGNIKTEEFDNLEGDRPSCFSGVKRRLFQSLQGHPYFHILTAEMVSKEVNNFVREHFKCILTNPSINIIDLSEAWDKLILGNQEVIPKLKILDISKEKQDEFMKYMSDKYGPSFREEPELLKYTNKQFSFLDPSKPENECHVAYYAFRVDFDGLLEQAKGVSIKIGESPLSVFALKSEKDEPDTKLEQGPTNQSVFDK